MVQYSEENKKENDMDDEKRKQIDGPVKGIHEAEAGV